MDRGTKQQVVVICGPTGSGKTSYAISYCKEHKGEIINADSRQVYQGLPIGTNKGVLTETGNSFRYKGNEFKAYELEQSGIIGWLFNILPANERFDLSQYHLLAGSLIKDISSRGKLPVIVGGTGLYIDSLVKGYQFSPALPDPELRKELENVSVTQLLQMLKDIDPNRAELLNESDRNNPRRIIRAIEIAQAKKTEAPDPEIEKINQELQAYDFTIYYPLFERQELFEKIDKRVIEMFQEGLVAETERAIALGYGDSEVLNGIGYKEVKKLLKGEIDQAQAIAQVQTAHRNYAKRQITWFEGAGRAYELKKITFH